jgi:hypothetical protein
VNSDVGEGGDLPMVSATKLGPCACPLGEDCPERAGPVAGPVAGDGEPEPSRADDRSHSPTIERLRPLVEKENRWSSGSWR